jgi:hypothetical protein
MRIKRVATIVNDEVVICLVVKETKGGNLSLLLLDNALNKVDYELFSKSASECVKVHLIKNHGSGAVLNYEKEVCRATLALLDAIMGEEKEEPPRKKKKTEQDTSDDVFSGTSPSSSSSSCSSLERRRQYSPSLKGQHDSVKNNHNLALCKQYNEMMCYYKRYQQKTSYAIFLDSNQLATQEALMKQCNFQEKCCLIPNPYEFETLQLKKSSGLYNMSLGAFMKTRVPENKVITFAWLDYMNSLDGNLQDQKCGEPSPREDIALYFEKWAKPYTLFAVTLCLRHSKYNTHDYSGGTEVVIMRYINDTARDAGFYFSIIPPTCAYGSSMFIYAGILLPLHE